MRSRRPTTIPRSPPHDTEHVAAAAQNPPHARRRRRGTARRGDLRERQGIPRALPGVALGSPLLLHADRTLALVGVAIAALGVLVQAARGRLPVELSTSGLRYEAEAADDAAAAVAELQDQFDELTTIVDALAARLDAPNNVPNLSAARWRANRQPHRRRPDPRAS